MEAIAHWNMNRWQEVKEARALREETLRVGGEVEIVKEQAAGPFGRYPPISVLTCRPPRCCYVGDAALRSTR